MAYRRYFYVTKIITNQFYDFVFNDTCQFYKKIIMMKINQQFVLVCNKIYLSNL